MADEEKEFEEEVMWGVVLKEKQRKGTLNSKKKKSLTSSSSSSSTSCLSAAWHSPAPKTMIPKAKNVVREGDNPALQQSSAPLKIPDWYNMQKGNRVSIRVDDDNGEAIMNNGDENVVETEDDDDGQMIPPHEYIAKKMARTRIASHSMCEGVGRTLKGRDLCKLRNAILTQTGFLEE